MFPFNQIPINLPPIVLLHAVGLTLHGARIVLKSSIQPTTPNNSNSSSNNNHNNHSTTRTAAAVADHNGDGDGDDGFKGLLFLGIGLIYLVTGSYLPEAQNAYLYGGIPVRILMAGIAGLRLGFVRNLSREARSELWMLVLADGVMAIVAGWQLGRFDGRLPGW